MNRLADNGSLQPMGHVEGNWNGMHAQARIRAALQLRSTARETMSRHVRNLFEISSSTGGKKALIDEKRLSDLRANRECFDLYLVSVSDTHHGGRRRWLGTKHPPVETRLHRREARMLVRLAAASGWWTPSQLAVVGRLESVPDVKAVSTTARKYFEKVRRATDFQVPGPDGKKEWRSIEAGDRAPNGERLHRFNPGAAGNRREPRLRWFIVWDETRVVHAPPAPQREVKDGRVEASLDGAMVRLRGRARILSIYDVVLDLDRGRIAVLFDVMATDGYTVPAIHGIEGRVQQVTAPHVASRRPLFEFTQKAVRVVSPVGIGSVIAPPPGGKSGIVSCALDAAGVLDRGRSGAIRECWLRFDTGLGAIELSVPIAVVGTPQHPRLTASGSRYYLRGTS